MWFWWDGTTIWMETSPTFPNARILRENPKAAVVIDESLGGLRLRAAIIDGEVDLVDGPEAHVLGIVRRIYARYLTPDELARDGEAMVAGSRHVLLRLTPTRIKTWDTAT
jgi:nitroimidazol reductase NimA-like FMN-containing flavoprotein (pyridoxamine 5'-phosphate oxidase superfamily)